MKIRPKQDYKRVLEEIRKEIEIHPDYADLQNLMGLFLTAGEDREGGERCFKEALRLNPRYREAILNLGFLYIGAGRWAEAEKIFLYGTTKMKKDGYLQYLLGITYHYQGEESKANQQLSLAIRNQPSLGRYYGKDTGRTGAKTSVGKKAEEAFKNIYPDHHTAQFHNSMGLYLAREGRSTQALRQLRKAADMRPDNFSFQSNLGRVYYFKGDYRKAAQAYQRALRINPGDGMGYAYLSFTYGLMRRRKQALSCMEKAVELNPRYADLHYNLALLYSDRGRFGEAIAELKKALRINPGYLIARINLGRVYEEKNLLEKARHEYRKVLRVSPDDEHVRRRLEGISP